MAGKQIIRNIIYAIVSLTIAIILFIVSNRQPFGRRNSSFAVDTDATVSSVEFTQGREKLTLEKIGDGTWTVNGKFEARTNGITFIEKVLTGIEIKSTVSEETFNEVITKKNIEPVRVKVFSGNKMIRSFLVYKTQSNSYGNIMKTSTNSKPFIVNVPGYDFDIGSAFTLNENYWRPYTLFSLLPADILNVELENGADTLASFIIENVFQENKVMIEPNYGAITDTSRIKRYLTYFSIVPFESWALDLTSEQVVDITGRKSLFRITINEANGKSTVVTFWPREINGALDTDRLWARINDNNNLVVVRYFDIDPVIKKISYFFVN